MTDRPYSLPLAMLLISAAALSGAYASQHLGGLQPCSLCLYQLDVFIQTSTFFFQNIASARCSGCS